MTINLRLARAVAMNLRGLRAIAFEVPPLPVPPEVRKFNRKERRALAARRHRKLWKR